MMMITFRHYALARPPLLITAEEACDGWLLIDLGAVDLTGGDQFDIARCSLVTPGGLDTS